MLSVCTCARVHVYVFSRFLSQSKEASKVITDSRCEHECVTVRLQQQHPDPGLEGRLPDGFYLLLITWICDKPIRSLDGRMVKDMKDTGPRGLELDAPALCCARPQAICTRLQFGSNFLNTDQC